MLARKSVVQVRRLAYSPPIKGSPILGRKSLNTKDTKYTKGLRKALDRCFSFVTFVFEMGFPLNTVDTNNNHYSLMATVFVTQAPLRFCSVQTMMTACNFCPCPGQVNTGLAT